MPEFYSSDEIDKLGANWNFVIGPRGDGKTTELLIKGIKLFFEKGYKMAYIRRYDEEFRLKKRSAYLFNATSEPGLIAKYPDGAVQTLSKGRYNTVIYSGREWKFAKVDKDGTILAKSDTFCIAFSLNNSVKDKGMPNLNFGLLVFDEAITDGFYLVNEFVILCNLVSTIVRNQSIAKIYLLANPVNMYCPYFKDMGLKHVRDMKPGEIQLYKFGDGKMKVAVEFIGDKGTGFKSDDYFAFDNPQLNMITKGEWQIKNYPRRPVKYVPRDVIYVSYLNFDEEWYRVSIITKDDNIFLYVEEQDGDPDIFEDTLVYRNEYDPRYNYRYNMLRPRSRVERKIVELIEQGKVFYETNYCGEAIRNYLMWCAKN